MNTPLTDPSLAFSHRVGREFGRHAAAYDGQARLQRAVAWRLGHLCRRKLGPLPDGPVADLGAGSGLLSQALLQHCPALRGRVPLQVDICRELLARNPLAAPAAGVSSGFRAETMEWNLNRGLPPLLPQAAMWVSSFALQWLEEPPVQLVGWIDRLVSGGWLVLAVPAAGSFPQWRRAAAEARVPFTGLELPAAAALISSAVGSGLDPVHSQLLRFTRPGQGGLRALRHLHRLGAASGRHPPLTTGQLRRLLARWPPHTSLTWEVLVLLGRKR